MASRCLRRVRRLASARRAAVVAAVLFAPGAGAPAPLGAERAGGFMDESCVEMPSGSCRAEDADASELLQHRVVEKAVSPLASPIEDMVRQNEGAFEEAIKADRGPIAEAIAEAIAEDGGPIAKIAEELQAKVTGLAACAGANQDPYATGYERPCCQGLQKCLNDWFGTGTWSYLCLSKCSADESPVAPQNTGFSICPSTTGFGTNSIWETGTSQYSCVDPAGVRGDGGFMCKDAGGAEDFSSIYVDMSTLSTRTGCWEWVTPACTWDMRAVRTIEFDVQWDQCDSLWFAPLWTFARPWVAPQGTSGEIDFVEACPVPTVTTNLGCYNANQAAGCLDAQAWGQGYSSNGPRHLVMTFVGSDLRIEVCDAAGNGCQQVAFYLNYLNIVHPTSNGRADPYFFVSDVWNSQGGDGGWTGCRAVRNPSTTCKYAVSNIQFTSATSSPVFGNPSSKCWMLNKDTPWKKAPDSDNATEPGRAARSATRTQ